MSGKTLAVIIAAVLGGLIIAGVALTSCEKGPVPAPASTSVIEQDDDNCLSVEELLERDEDCGYDAKSPKPVVTKTTVPTTKPATVKPRNTRRS